VGATVDITGVGTGRGGGEEKEGGRGVKRVKGRTRGSGDGEF